MSNDNNFDLLDLTIEKLENKQFYKVEIQLIKVNDQDFRIIKLTEVSAYIKIWLFSSEKKLLKMINACVSHEMRNPLNSLFSMIQKLHQLH